MSMGTGTIPPINRGIFDDGRDSLSIRADRGESRGGGAMRKLQKPKRGIAICWVLPTALVLACGGSDEPAGREEIEGAVKQAAEGAAKAIAEGGDVDDEWPFTYREVDALRITSRTENVVEGSYTETVLEYVRPDRTRDVSTVVSGPGEEPVVAERVFTSDHSYMWFGGKLMTMEATQDPVAAIDDALRLNTSAGRLEDNHKMREFMQELEGREDLNGVETFVYHQGDLDVILGGEQVKGFSRTWVGADDGLVYKMIREAESESAHQRSTTTYEYGETVAIEIPEEDAQPSG